MLVLLLVGGQQRAGQALAVCFHLLPVACTARSPASFPLPPAGPPPRCCCLSRASSCRRSRRRCGPPRPPCSWVRAGAAACMQRGAAWSNLQWLQQQRSAGLLTYRYRLPAPPAPPAPVPRPAQHRLHPGVGRRDGPRAEPIPRPGPPHRLPLFADPWSALNPIFLRCCCCFLLWAVCAALRAAACSSILTTTNPLRTSHTLLGRQGLRGVALRLGAPGGRAGRRRRGGRPGGGHFLHDCGRQQRGAVSSCEGCCGRAGLEF